ncbi:MAG: DUF3493 domain-containing protein [Microcystaceae cyanobacterium]
MSNSSPNRPPSSKLTPERYARLKAEAEAPYRGLRLFIYLGLGGSGFIGAVVFLAKIASGQINNSTLPSFALQVGIVALMIWFYRLEQKNAKKG